MCESVKFYLDLGFDAETATAMANDAREGGVIRLIYTLPRD